MPHFPKLLIPWICLVPCITKTLGNVYANKILFSRYFTLDLLHNLPQEATGFRWVHTYRKCTTFSVANHELRWATSFNDLRRDLKIGNHSIEGNDHPSDLRSLFRESKANFITGNAKLKKKFRNLENEADLGCISAKKNVPGILKWGHHKTVRFLANRYTKKQVEW